MTISLAITINGIPYNLHDFLSGWSLLMSNLNSPENIYHLVVIPIDKPIIKPIATANSQESDQIPTNEIGR